MDKTALVEAKIEAGELLLQELEKSGFPVDVAFWLYRSESERWRLVIASPFVTKHGPRKAYEAIRIVFDSLNITRKLLEGTCKRTPIDLDEISVMSTNDPLIRGLRSTLRTGRTISGIRLSHNLVNNIYVEDAYVYRVA